MSSHGKFRTLDLEKIDEPDRPIRSTIQDAGLDELAESMKREGLIQPIAVRPGDDGRYIVLAGHRRLLAARILNWPKIAALVYDDESHYVSILVHENFMREDVSPADEAIFYAELFERHGEDVDRVVELVGRPRAHVENRLLLLRGYPEVFEALSKGEISIGVAQELNSMVRANDAQYYLHYAVKDGARVAVVREWKNRANARAQLAATDPDAVSSSSAADPDARAEPPPQQTFAAVASPANLSESVNPQPCIFCPSREPEWKMYRVWVCKRCADQYLAKLSQPE